MQEVIQRYWRHAEAEEIDGVWSAKLAVSSVDKPLWVDANVAYPLDEPVSGAGYYYGIYTAASFNISSLLKMVTPDELATAGTRATCQPSLLIESFEGDWDKEWFSYKLDEWSLSTYKISDARFAAPQDSALALDVRTQDANTLVILIDDYAAEVHLKPHAIDVRAGDGSGSLVSG